ncbi:hypothetical protein LZC95_14215 [Pendulispora brunnea]|uniref:Uncharacterized protein n=1 Tax=Pendulispora brunnea TaxID=2905690 RepID=A0ABZ2KH33_9BACT
MKHDEDGWQLESVPFEDETDPSFPARLGERAAAQGSLNVSGSPRIDRTNPHFLWPAKPTQEPESKIVTKPVSKEPTQLGLGEAGEKSPKEAVTQDAPASREAPVSSDKPPVSSAQRELDKNLLLAGIAPALAPDESGLRERVKEDDEARARRERNESIDELIDGLPFEAALPRKKSARRIREEEESRPRRPPLPSLTAQGPLHTGTGDIAAALRERAERAKISRTGSLVPAGLTQGRTPIIGGVALLAGLIVAAFFVARSTNPAPAAAPAAAASAPAAVTAATAAIENIPPPATSAAAPSEAEGAAVPVVVTSPSASDSAHANASNAANVTGAGRPRNANGAPHAKRPSQGGEEGTGLDTSSLDGPGAGAGKRPRSVATQEPAEPPASPAPSSDDKLLTGH